MGMLEHPDGKHVAPWFIRGLSFALRNHATLGPVQVLLLVPALVREAVRANDQRHARVTLDVPDEVARDLRDQASSDCDVYALVRVPRLALERSSSPIVLPGEQQP